MAGVLKLLLEIIEEGFDLHFLLQKVGLCAVPALLTHCLHEILDV